MSGGGRHRGGRTIQKVGAQITLKLKKVGAQTFHFHYLRLKKWVRSCTLCALGSAAPEGDKILKKSIAQPTLALLSISSQEHIEANNFERKHAFTLILEVFTNAKIVLQRL